MSEAKHTAGPWFVQYVGDNVEVASGHPPSGVLITTCGGMNARLIAAAPDMLAALENQAALDDNSLSSMSDRQIRALIREYRDEARAALHQTKESE